MSFLWPELATWVGVSAHVVAGVSATYLAYWCWRSWKATRLSVAFALAWFMVVVALLSVYRFSDLLATDGTLWCAVTVEFGIWIRVMLAVTLSYVAWYVYRLGRGKA